jgi:CRP-like cAMP-binding protein
MFESLYTYINNYSSVPLSKRDFDLVKEAFTYRKVRRRQLLLQQREVCMHFAFIVSGAMRQYIVDEKGTQHIVHLGIENWWMGDRESFVLFTPSKTFIEAWEDTELLIISRANQLKLVHDFPAFGEMVRKMDELNNIANQKRIVSSISLAAKKRYADFVGRYPEFANRFPQHMIASYLGITKETLSRVRKRTS